MINSAMLPGQRTIDYLHAAFVYGEDSAQSDQTQHQQENKSLNAGESERFAFVLLILHGKPAGRVFFLVK